MSPALIDALVGEKVGCLQSQQTLEGRRRGVSEEDMTALGIISRFLADKVAILNSKAFRRLAGKAQVVTLPINCHIRNRLSHTAEVVACAIAIAYRLGLNIDLVEAIAWGHDIGHVPFGHVGEAYIAARLGQPFCHETMGVVIAQHIERRGRGLNLTHQVLSGMLQHSGGAKFAFMEEDMIPEARVVRLADKIAYLFADYNDFRRLGFPLGPQLIELAESFGQSQRERQKNVIDALCRESAEKNRVEFNSSPEAKRFSDLRTLMYDVYPRITIQDPRRHLDHIFSFVERLQLGDPVLIVSLMTDADIVFLAEQPMLNMSHLQATAVGELFDTLSELKVNYLDPDLNW